MTPTTPTDAPTPRVLIVEDDAVQLDALSELLAARGWLCDRAANAEAALSRMAVYSYAALVVDLYMPGMGGLELLRRLRAQERWRSVPVALVTAASGPALDEVRAELAALAPAALAQKPCGAEEVGAALAALLSPPEKPL